MLSARHERNYKKVILRDGFVVGMVFASDIEKSGIVFNLMKDRVEVDGFKKALIADDFGLSFLPEEIWRKRLERPGSQVVSQERSGAIPEKAIVRQ